jgi:hypothetical protein
MKINRRRPLVVERRNTAPTLKLLGIISGDRNRLEGIVDNQRIIATRDQSIRDRTEYRLYSEPLARKPRVVDEGGDP